MTRRLALVAPGDMNRVSGGYIYDRRLIKALCDASVDAFALVIPDLAPESTEAAVAEAAARMAQTDAPLLIDGLAHGAFPEELAESIGPRAVSLVHHPLHLERGLPEARAQALFESERAALRACRGALTTSRTTARQVTDAFGLDASRVRAAEPGVDPSPRAPIAGDPVVMLAVGALIPRKGYDLLLDALELVADVPWRLDIAGPEDPNPAHARSIKERVAASSVRDRVRFHGAVDPARLAELRLGADVFVSAAQHEGYGMAAVEAVAAGLPVAYAGGGALSEAVRGAGIGTQWRADALAGALRPILSDPALRAAEAAKSWRAAQDLPRWAETAAKCVAALDALQPRGWRA